MEKLQYSKFNFQIELINILIIVAAIVFSLTSDVQVISKVLPVFLILFLYGIITMVNYITLLESSIFKKKTKNSIDLGIESDLTVDERIAFIKTAVFHSGIFKLFITLIPVAIVFVTIYEFSQLLFVPLMIALVFVSVYYAFKMSYFLAMAKGLNFEDLKDFFKKGLFYYNPEDERAFVDKPVGVGTTINFASKTGRRFFVILMSVPVLIILILVFVNIFK